MKKLCLFLLLVGRVGSRRRPAPHAPPKENKPAPAPETRRYIPLRSRIRNQQRKSSCTRRKYRSMSRNLRPTKQRMATSRWMAFSWNWSKPTIHCNSSTRPRRNSTFREENVVRDPMSGKVSGLKFLECDSDTFESDRFLNHAHRTRGEIVPWVDWKVENRQRCNRMSDFLFARSQMAMSLAFHIVFAALGIGMRCSWPSLRACICARSNPCILISASGGRRALPFCLRGSRVGHRSSRSSLVCFGRFHGACRGNHRNAVFAEGFAFFTEAIFLGVYLYGWKARFTARSLAIRRSCGHQRNSFRHLRGDRECVDERARRIQNR